MLEFSESAALVATSTVDTVLEELRALGIRVAVDDFGRGHSSLIRLLRLPATDLKITPELIDTVPGSPQARAIVRAAREMADSIGLRVIATGARTPPHLLAARDAGAHAVQGQAISPPLMPPHAHAYLLDRTHNTDLPTSSKVIQLRPHPDDAG